MSLEAPSNRQVHFHNLDVLRFFAAFMIVIVHGYSAVLGWEGLPEPLRKDATQAASTEENLNSLGFFLNRLIQNFDLGVEFFFLISGFLITYLMLSELNVSGKLNIPKFYMRRLLRIWPLYFLVIAITPFLAEWTDSAHPNYLWNIFFGNNYLTIIQKSYEPGLAHLWSICVEEHFYLVWPILLFFVPVNRLPLLFSFLIFVSIISRWYYFETSPEWLNHTKLNTICRMDTLAIGGWIAWLMHRKPYQVTIQGWIRLLVYVLLVLLLCFDDTHKTDSFFLVAFKRLVYTGIFSFLLLNYLYNPGAWFNFKRKNILHYLGKISFGIYMYHNILFPALFQKIIWGYKLQGFWIFWLLYLTIVLVISVLSYEIYEKQFLKLKDRFAIVLTKR
jgi:peptidoglycan/LPS O-acetylase OafA/YrhL